MSADAINYLLTESFSSNERLAAYYDFTITGSSVNNSFYISGSSPYTGILKNFYPAYNTGKYQAHMLSATGSTLAIATGLSFSGIRSGLNLSRTNLRIPIHDLNLDDFGMIIDFEFSGPITDGILFGTFEKFTETVNGINYTGSKGFNVGVDCRGHLFLQAYGSDGDQISSLLNIELSKRNIIGISSYGDSISVSRLDYLNNSIEQEEIQTTSNYIANSDYLYFGGSNQYYRSTSPANLTFSGSINQLAIFSGVVSDYYLKYIGSGIIGDYFYSAPVETIKTRITGYSDSVIYKTGITGYEYQVTGTLTLHTGREYITGSYQAGSSQSVKEGERYFKYYNLYAGGQNISYKEELGFLHPNSGYIYYPTGDGAFATLGLQNVSQSITNYIITEVTGQESTTINLYGKIAKTGLLNEISGVVQTPLTESYSEFTDPASGILFSGNSQNLKKNYIYYLGGRDS
jgi:hypothetical protein